MLICKRVFASSFFPLYFLFLVPSETKGSVLQTMQHAGLRFQVLGVEIIPECNVLHNQM